MDELLAGMGGDLESFGVETYPDKELKLTLGLDDIETQGFDGDINQ